MSPIVSSVVDYPWQLFGTFTFTGAGVSSRIALSMFHAVVRQQARYWHLHFDAVRYLLRFERGEVNRRFHIHALISGLPPRAIEAQNRLVIMSQWEGMGGGMARVRRYVGSFGDSSYVLKDESGQSAGVQSGQDNYELNKFGLNVDVILSKRLIGDLVSTIGGRLRGSDSREGAKMRFRTGNRKPTNVHQSSRGSDASDTVHKGELTVHVV